MKEDLGISHFILTLKREFGIIQPLLPLHRTLEELGLLEGKVISLEARAGLECLRGLSTEGLGGTSNQNNSHWVACDSLIFFKKPTRRRSV